MFNLNIVTELVYMWLKMRNKVSFNFKKSDFYLINTWHVSYTEVVHRL